MWPSEGIENSRPAPLLLEFCMPYTIDLRFLSRPLTVGLAILILVANANGWANAAPASKPATAARGPDYVDQLSARVEPTRKVIYKKVGDRELALHIFEPQGYKPMDKRSCFVSIHGGGWTGMSPRRMYPFVTHAASLGMLGIAVEYRLAGKNGVTVYDCVRDSRSALRYIRSHAAELGIDPQKIVAHGGSAGGHLAAGTALFDGFDEPGEDPAKVSCVPNALVLLFPVIDTSGEGYGNARLGERWKEISPLHRVRPGTPPTIIFHGTGDTVTPYKGAKLFTEAMVQAKNHCELVTNEGGAHGYLMREKGLLEETLQRTEQFLVQQGFVTRGLAPAAPKRD